MGEMPKWRRFEELVAAIHEDLAPEGASVSRNEYIMGRHSGVRRQIDVAVRVPTDGEPLLLVIDAKDHARKLDVKEIETFLGFVDDVGANRGAIISPVGFTTAAFRRAEAGGVEAWTAFDVESHDWRASVAIPVLVDKRAPVFRFEFSWTGPFAISVGDIPNKMILDRSGTELGTPLLLAARLWDHDHIDPDQSDEQKVRLHNGDAFVREEEGLVPVTFSAIVRVESTYYFGPVPLAKMRGLAVPGGTTIRTRGFTTDWITFEDVEQKWRRLNSLTEISVKPLLTIVSLAVLGEQPRI